MRQHRWLIIDGTTEGALLHLCGQGGVLGFRLIHDGFTDQKDVLLEFVLGPHSAF